MAARIPDGIRHFFSWNPCRIRHFFLVESQESLGIIGFFLWNPGIPETWNPGNLESWKPGTLWLFSYTAVETPNYLIFITEKHGLK